VEVLLTAAKGIGGDKPLLPADGGVENFNGAVDELIASGLLSRVLAQTEITFSNSLIESWWRVLKHQWLFLNTLDSVRTVEKLVAFYVQEHNARLPHSAFRGQTPDEMSSAREARFLENWRRPRNWHAKHERRPIGSGPVARVSR